ncbi:hypothetical protein TRFO_15487 [Tritrichomonas foetus]|uniref:Small RNA 2'-O-methyltransferase n=1 Tax=Tritrichomonas foetus TaxID=1144522 RepID=A0A1J4KWX0_9EUKA|nr:hypothetical protein TRFO_15487 [Tritrichomonas foetus]|eukprot:OHT14198.1 hypothetical protein TRFO_15487 [Tritrichomonas foetus]
MTTEVSNPFLRPLASQRYCQAFSHIKVLKPKFIIDFGCAECDFLFYLSKNPEGLDFSIGVDCSINALNKGKRNISVPGIFYSKTRPYNLFLLNEDVTKLSDDFIKEYKNSPFVTFLELIEHLDQDELRNFENEIFSKLQPEVVYLTTPNIEYNEILTRSFGKDRRFGEFRHVDHKFEFTRSEFREWCNKICEKYNYSANIDGVGKTLDGEDDGNHGCGSHSVLFTLKAEKVKTDFKEPEKFVHSHTINVKIESPDDQILFYNLDDEDNDNYSDDDPEDENEDIYNEDDEQTQE